MHETRERAAGEILESRSAIHTASNSYSYNFPAVTATVLQGNRMVDRKFTSCTGSSPKSTAYYFLCKPMLALSN